MSKKPTLDHNVETISDAHTALAKMKAIEASRRSRSVQIGRHTLVMGSPAMVEEIARQLAQPI